ncbi:hypothetical protein [Synechococcus elongatus]|uniref:hypothetical protein n=1 Tax=Synechococcus elongatus TaxID=32046 RepID=UPI000F7EA8DF|nr:hypothetical protein [Synechococcus elongatus]
MLPHEIGWNAVPYNSGCCERAIVVRWLALVLVLVLSACTAFGLPDRAVIRAGLTLQLQQTETQLSDQLRLATPIIRVQKLKIRDRKPLDIGGRPAFQVLGQATWQLQQSGQKQQIKAQPFELYLQRQPQARTWRLAIPQPSSQSDRQEWSTYAIPLA